MKRQLKQAQLSDDELNAVQQAIDNKNAPVEERKLLEVLIKDGTRELIEAFLVTKRDSFWQSIKEILLDEDDHVNEAKLQ